MRSPTPLSRADSGHRCRFVEIFDTIPHAKLLAVVAERIVDSAMLGLIRRWLKAAVIEEDEQGKATPAGGGKGNRRGTPQGGVTSPLLANLYLHLLDRIWERHDLANGVGARLVRYADDPVILCVGNVDRPMRVLRDVLNLLGLRLNEQKTRIVNAYKEILIFSDSPSVCVGVVKAANCIHTSSHPRDRLNESKIV